MFPTFPFAIGFKGLCRGTLVFDVPLFGATFPGLSLDTLRKTFPTFPFDRELPALGLMGDAQRTHAHLAAVDIEDPVAHAGERLAEPCAL